MAPGESSEVPKGPFRSKIFNTHFGDKADEAMLPKHTNIEIPEKSQAQILKEDLAKRDKEEAENAGNLTVAQQQEMLVNQNKTAVHFEEGSREVAKSGLRHDILEQRRSGGS